MNGLDFLAGFLVGGFTTFVVTALTVWKPLLDEKRDEAKLERARRLEAEMYPLHWVDRQGNITVVPTRKDWESPPVPAPKFPLRYPEDIWDGEPPEIVDLTGVDDVPE